MGTFAEPSERDQGGCQCGPLLVYIPAVFTESGLDDLDELIEEDALQTSP